MPWGLKRRRREREEEKKDCTGLGHCQIERAREGGDRPPPQSLRPKAVPQRKERRVDTKLDSRGMCIVCRAVLRKISYWPHSD